MFEPMVALPAAAMLDVAPETIDEAAVAPWVATPALFTMPSEEPELLAPVLLSETEPQTFEGTLVGEGIDPQLWLAAALQQQQLKLGAQDYAGARLADHADPMAAFPAPAPAPRPATVPVTAMPIGVVSPLSGAPDTAAAVVMPPPASAPATFSLAPAVDASASPVAAPERQLTLLPPEARWGEQMLHALRDSVQLQVRQGFQQAVIRLEPAELGSLEIRVSHEAGRVSVQIFAAQQDVSRLLQGSGERLRLELMEQHFTQAQVQVMQHPNERQRDSRQPEQPPEDGIADNPLQAVLSDTGHGRQGSTAHGGLLVTV